MTQHIEPRVRQLEDGTYAAFAVITTVGRGSGSSEEIPVPGCPFSTRVEAEGKAEDFANQLWQSGAIPPHGP